jgi:hypothetical protein
MYSKYDNVFIINPAILVEVTIREDLCLVVRG